MSLNSSSRFKALWVLPPIIVGIVILMVMKSGKLPPQPSNAGEPVRVVQTLTVHRIDFTPIAQGYGVVQPAEVWKAVAQVSGRIIETHPRLNNGEIITRGETLYQVDPVDYELNLAQAKTQLAELDVQLANTEASLKIEQKNLALSKKEFNRLQKLLKKGGVSQSSVDAAERAMLGTRLQVQNLQNSLSLIPSQKKLQQAKITQAERDLANTKIRAPFNMKVSGLAIEKDQFVSKGQLMFSGDAIDRAEIVAQVSLSALKNLFLESSSIPHDITSLSSNLSDITGFKPEVILDMGGDQSARWQAQFVRFSDTVDPQTRTLGVVVAVDKPLQKVIPGKRPPLSKGMFVEVDIAGKIQPGSIVVPRAALRNGHAYVMNSEQRLEIRKVKKAYDQQLQTVISSGLEDGDILVLTDLIPAVEGMLLKPVNAGE
jgi:RND family efflux transporter MFP subunit